MYKISSRLVESNRKLKRTIATAASVCVILADQPPPSPPLTTDAPALHLRLLFTVVHIRIKYLWEKYYSSCFVRFGSSTESNLNDKRRNALFPRVPNAEIFQFEIKNPNEASCMFWTVIKSSAFSKLNVRGWFGAVYNSKGRNILRPTAKWGICCKARQKHKIREIQMWDGSHTELDDTCVLNLLA